MNKARGPNPGSEATLLALIDRLYAAATDPSLWPSFLEPLAAATSSKAAIVVVEDFRHRTGSALWHHGTDATVLGEYDRWAPKNVYFLKGGHLLRTGAVVNAEEAVPDREVVGTEFFEEYFRRLDVMHHMAAGIFREPSLGAFLYAFRAIGKPSHSSAELSLLRALTPHVQRVIAIHRQLHAIDLRRVTAEQALDRLAIGIFLLDDQGIVVFQNAAAREVVTQADGLAIERSGLLAARRPSENSALQGLVAGACRRRLESAAPGGALRIRRPSGRRSYSMFVAPLRLRDFLLAPERPAAVVFVSDPEQGISGVEAFLNQLYALTRAEAAVAMLLCEGLRVAEIAERLAITENTTRTHVRHILEKTDARGQSDLVRMLLSGIAGLKVESRP